MGQAVPEIPLSEGSKLELHCTSQSFVLPNFRILPRTRTHLSAYVHVYCRVYLYVCIILAVHCIYTPRVLHFSAFINFVVIMSPLYNYTKREKTALARHW